VEGLQAVVFDFDGLIADTEMPIYRTNAAALTALGHDVTVPEWATLIGLGEADSWAAICALVGTDLDLDAFDAAYQAQDRSDRDHIPAADGVVDLLAALASEGMPCGVASSSSASWVEGHLVRLGLRDRFASVATADRVGGRSKPAPDTYLLACEELGADPAHSVALEDSAPGIAAALAAGLTVVAVPSEITRHTDLSAAHGMATSLADLVPEDLARLIADR
jgi:HAD superfamily hydrolase (TIGR01509 family)